MLRRNSHITWKELKKKSSRRKSSCSQDNIQHTLNNKDLHGTVARNKFFLQAQYTIKHLKYAKENIEKPEAFENNVLWTVKTKMWNFLPITKEGNFWTKKGDAFVEKNTLPTVKHGGGSIMLWGCVAAGGTGNIV